MLLCVGTSFLYIMIVYYSLLFIFYKMQFFVIFC
uniref:Uncharacterized protein n=1 Tax=Polysiphonia sertularioides TaxID=945028 RepID=A0A1Z1M921_9FLOR|nr:hypothetical protein [Polysiphonia sertularioides]ARW62392.1 hypothetical protein [Polysiphonia sertularioides]